MNFYVGNLAYTVKEEDLQNLFTPFGEVASAKIVMNHYSGQSKGFGFVEMPNNTDADKAIKALQGQELQGKNIKISQAENKKKPQRRGRRR